MEGRKGLLNPRLNLYGSIPPCRTHPHQICKIPRRIGCTLYGEGAHIYCIKNDCIVFIVEPLGLILHTAARRYVVGMVLIFVIVRNIAEWNKRFVFLVRRRKVRHNTTDYSKSMMPAVSGDRRRR